MLSRFCHDFDRYGCHYSTDGRCVHLERRSMSRQIDQQMDGDNKRRNRSKTPVETTPTSDGLEPQRISPSADPLDPRLPLAMRQNAILRMQKTHGNAAVVRFLAQRTLANHVPNGNAAVQRAPSPDEDDQGQQNAKSGGGLWAAIDPGAQQQGAAAADNQPGKTPTNTGSSGLFSDLTIGDYVGGIAPSVNDRVDYQNLRSTGDKELATGTDKTEDSWQWSQDPDQIADAVADPSKPRTLTLEQRRWLRHRLRGWYDTPQEGGRNIIRSDPYYTMAAA